MTSWIPQERYELTGQEIVDFLDFGKKRSYWSTNNEICLSRLKFKKDFEEGQRVRVSIVKKGDGWSELFSEKVSVHYITPTLLNVESKPINILFSPNYSNEDYDKQIERFWSSIETNGLYELVLKKLAVGPEKNLYS